MTYGVKVWGTGGEESGTLLLDISDRTPRLIAVAAVTVPAGENTSTTVTVTGASTTNVAITDSGAPAVVSATNTVIVYGTYSGGATNIKILEL